MINTAALSSQTNRIEDLLTPYSMPTQFIDIGAGRLAYTEMGDGETTLLFIHGLSSNLDAFQKNIPELSKHARCIAVDLPGFGRSVGLTLQGYTIPEYATILNQFIELKKLKRVILIGHSMGGQIALWSQIHATSDRVMGMILLAPAGLETFSETDKTALLGMVNESFLERLTEHQIRQSYRLNFHEWSAVVEKMYLDRCTIRAASDFKTHLKAIRESVQSMLEHTVFDQLNQITLPSLVLFGNQDMLIPNRFLHPQLSLQSMLDTCKRHWNTRFVCLEQAGHFVQIDQYEEVNKRIIEFVNQRQ